MILVAGGDADPNLIALRRRLAGRDVRHLSVCAGGASSPRLTWRLADDRLWIDGVEVRPAALFLRYDVFTPMQDRRPASRQSAGRWYHTLLSWALAHDEVAFLNRTYGARHATKPYVSCLAQRFGLETPETLVTNDPDALDGLEDDGWIAKPVNGGEFTRLLAEARADAARLGQGGAAPTIVQRRLIGPDLRIYRVGARWFAFTLQSEALDYRTTAAVTIGAAPAPAGLVRPLGRLMDALGLDFGAADFKTCPETGRSLFLEVNSAPMFAAFDRVVGGALCDAILDRLTPEREAAAYVNGRRLADRPAEGHSRF